MSSRLKAKNRKVSRTFTSLPHNIFRANYADGEQAPVSRLSHSAFHLLINMSSQFNGSNNGDLSAAPKIMVAYGWNSRSTLADALCQLRKEGFIELTRQGGRNKCSLYALTWLPIHECGGKLDVSPTKVASNLWKKAGSN